MGKVKEKNSVDQDLRSENIPVLGMSCAACALTVEEQVQKQEGVAEASVNYASKTLQVKYSEDKVKPTDLQKAVQDAGYDLLLEGGEEEAEEIRHEEFHRLRRRMLLAGAFAIPLFVVGMFLKGFAWAPWVAGGLATPILFVFGRQFYLNAFRQARHGKANMDSLVALSTGIAYAFSLFNLVWPEFWLKRGLEAHVYFEAAGLIIFFILLGRFLEEKAKAQTSGALQKLIGLQPKTVHRINESGEEEEVPLARVEPGDVLFIRPGERIPVDGKLLMGRSFVDESSISGEPVPVEKTAGSALFAGTVNQKGIFRFEAEKVGKATVLGQIIEQVRQAQGSKAPVQKLADKVAGIFVPVVMGIAALTFVLWLVFGGPAAVSVALMAMVTVLVIACPCALGLATPTAIMVGVGKAAEKGILVKDAQSLELGKKVDTVVLDKTGTLTEGKPELSRIFFADEEEAEALKKALYNLERQSEHPLAQAVVSGLGDQEDLNIDKFAAITGKGLKGSIEGKEYFLGNERLMEEKAFHLPEALRDPSADLKKLSVTRIFLASEGKVRAVLGVADQLKDTSVAAVQALQGMGIEVIMLTGDNVETATAVAKTAGIERFAAEMLPGDKAAFIEKLQSEGKTVAMVGDGINDSQALATADVSVAMGQGSDIAMDVAKMTIISSDLLKLPEALQLSRKTLATIRQNLFWAFFYNVVGIPIAAGLLYPFTGFLLNPMVASAAMALSSVSVVGNSLRLRYSA